MYIVYDGYQKEVVYSEGITIPGIRIKLEEEEVLEFKPSLLVRVADMEVVEGSTVDDHYWTISYSWNQSGEIFKNDDGEYDRVDDGKHEIITYQPGTEEFYDWMPVASVDRDTASTQYGKFEQVIRQICNDFGVEYIWYDQMCINQNDHDAKIQEIKQMHRIYKNARCTIALIPELEFVGDTDESGLDNTDLDVIPESQWSRRIWTLEEAYMSRNILFLGRNVHLWSSDLEIRGVGDTDHFLENINKADTWRASTALWYARTRTSTKAHDRVFALVNIFPELKHGITFSYRQPLIDLMVQFYGLLAQNDISILLFGASNYTDSDEEIAVVRQEEASLLPSWTGAAGVHLSQDQLDNEHVETTLDYTLDGKYMNLTSAFIPIRIEPADSVEIHDPADGPHNGYTEDGLPWVLCDADAGCEDVRIEDEEQVLTFVAVPSESQDDYPNYIKHNGLKTTHFLPTKEDNEEWIQTLSKPTHISAVLSLIKECSECFVLTDVVFPLNNELFQFHPVIGKYEDHYEAIGACFLLCELNFDSLVDQVKRDFVIE